MHAFIGGSDETAMYAPSTYIKAQMSLPYTLAVTLLDGELFLNQYSPERLTDKGGQGSSMPFTKFPSSFLAFDLTIKSCFNSQRPFGDISRSALTSNAYDKTYR